MNETKKSASAAAELRQMAAGMIEQAAQLEAAGAKTRSVATMLEEGGRAYVAAAKALRREAKEG